MFSLKHIILLSISIIFIVISSIFSNKLKFKTILKIMLFTGIVSETLKVFTYIILNEAEYGGYLPKGDLPFHLCSIQIIFFIILNLTQNEKIKKLLIGFMLPTCLVGGLAALLIPTSSSLNVLTITIEYFGYHAMIVNFAIYLLRSKEITFTAKDYVNTLIMLFATFFVAIYLNSWIADYVQNVNFMYVVGPPQSGLPYLNKDHGWFVYIVHYALLAVFVVTLLYIKPIIEFFKNKKAKAE